MTAKSPALRNRESRARKRERGLVRTEVVVYPEDRDAVHDFAAALRARRQRELEQQEAS